MGSINAAESSAVEYPRRLNVILHGLFVFDQQDDEIIAYIPDMGSEHLYKAGGWLTETNLEEHGDFKLEGIRATNLTIEDIPREDHDLVKFDRDTRALKGYSVDARHNIDLGNALVRPAAKECHCIHATLRFPYPPYPIKSLRRIRIPAGDLGGDSSERLVEGRREIECASVQVLTYDFDDDNNLELGDHPWEPALADGYVNLHIFSEPERMPTDDHIRHAFQAGVELLAGVDLVLRGPVRADVPEDAVAGVHEFELQDLVQRQRWLAVLGRSIKEGRDGSDIWDDPTPFFGSLGCTGCFVLRRPGRVGRAGYPSETRGI